MSHSLINQDLVKPFNVLISNLPSELGDLPEDQQWRPVKDEMRRIRPREAARVAQQESNRTGRCVTQDRIQEIETLLDTYEPPMNDVRNGVATLGFNSFDEAIRTYEFVQGHIWKGYVLEAWLLRKNKGDLKDFLGPIDRVTGALRPAPTPRRLARLSMTPNRGDPSGYRTPLRSHSIASSYGSSEESITTSYLEGVSHSFQRRQDVPRVSSSPSSSRNTSISSPSTTVFRDAHAATSTFQTVPHTLGSPFASVQRNIANRTATRANFHVDAQGPTPPSSISDNIPRFSTTASAPTRCYKVTIRNLSLEATKECVGELIEQKTRIYVPLVQPQPIKLQPHKGQFHAYVKFTHIDDAEKAVRGIRGLKFLGRPLQAILEIVIVQ